MSKKKFLYDTKYGKHWVRCWKEGRAAIMVQVWLNCGEVDPNSQPDGDWEMPSFLGVNASIAQAVLQTENKGECHD